MAGIRPNPVPTAVVGSLTRVRSRDSKEEHERCGIYMSVALTMVKSDLARLAPGCPGNRGRLRRHGAVQPERLGPAIHAFEEPKQGVDAGIQVRAGRFGFIALSPPGSPPRESPQVILLGKFLRTAPAHRGRDNQRRPRTTPDLLREWRATGEFRGRF
jgi:hypothetical protein